MEIESLKTVALVAHHGSFAAAARVLDVDPSTVSRTVAGVEAALGLRLFQRSTRSLTVTEEGAVYLRRITPMLDEIDMAADEARTLRSLPSGRLRMTASVAFSHECIIPHLAAFNAACPKVTVELLPTDTNVDIRAEKIDLAIRLAAAPEGDLISARLMTTRYLVCAAPEYLDRAGPIRAPDDLHDHACLRFALPEFRSVWKFRRDGVRCDVPIDGQVLISNALGLRRAAREGLGPALLPDWLVREDLAAGRLRDVLPGWECTATSFDTAAWILYPSRAYLPRKVRAMVDFLRDRLR